jgi:DNA-binding FadR family transcriptional regulator
MPARRKADTGTETRREDEKTATIVTRGLEVPDLPKNIIASELRSRIERGIFRPGEQVPSIAEIMAQTEPKVAKNTARAALDILRDSGYIKTLTGFGSFVNPPDRWGKSPDDE